MTKFISCVHCWVRHFLLWHSPLTQPAASARGGEKVCCITSLWLQLHTSLCVDLLYVTQQKITQHSSYLPNGQDANQGEGQAVEGPGYKRQPASMPCQALADYWRHWDEWVSTWCVCPVGLCHNDLKLPLFLFVCVCVMWGTCLDRCKCHSPR